MAVDGEKIVVCAGVLPIYLDNNAMEMPIIKRHGNVIRPEIRSFLPGLTAQYSSFHSLIIMYQIKARAGMQYSTIFTTSAEAEKPVDCAFVPVNTAAAPEKNRTIYKIIASKYIPITMFLYYNK